MTQNSTGTFVTATIHLPDDLSAADLLLHLKYAQALGISLVEFGWPKPQRVSATAAA